MDYSTKPIKAICTKYKFDLPMDGNSSNLINYTCDDCTTYDSEQLIGK